MCGRNYLLKYDCVNYFLQYFVTKKKTLLKKTPAKRMVYGLAYRQRRLTAPGPGQGPQGYEGLWSSFTRLLPQGSHRPYEA